MLKDYGSAAFPFVTHCARMVDRDAGRAFAYTVAFAWNWRSTRAINHSLIFLCIRSIQLLLMFPHPASFVTHLSCAPTHDNMCVMVGVGGWGGGGNQLGRGASVWIGLKCSSCDLAAMCGIKITPKRAVEDKPNASSNCTNSPPDVIAKAPIWHILNGGNLHMGTCPSKARVQYHSNPYKWVQFLSQISPKRLFPRPITASLTYDP